MGVLLSRFQKKKPVEVLEKLENEMKEIEKSKSRAQTRCKQITKLLYFYSMAVSIICGIVVYFKHSSVFEKKLIYLMGLAIFCLIIFIINKITSWYYIYKINKSQSRLMKMNKEKKRILDEIMDKETYKVAKEILDKFSNDVPKPIELRKRITDVSSSPVTQQQASPIKNSLNLQNYGPNKFSPVVPKASIRMPGPEPGPIMHLPAPILPLERSYLDKMVEYLIGDGPNNRFALICSKCHSHNGMALKEEFEYLSFKCCYCFFFNPARKIRPEAPKLEESQFSHVENNNSESDSNNISSDENNEEIADDKKNIDSTATNENDSKKLILSH